MKLNLLSNWLKKPLVVAVCRYLLAALFLFSGVAKAINPFGLSNQIGDYYNAMGFDFLHGTQLAAAVILPALEILLGLFLLFGVFRKIVAWALILVMSGFTILTLWIAIANPVNDCGCFGEVLKISNWATFYKNVFFTALAVIFFASRNEETQKYGNFYTVTLVLTAFIVPFNFLWKLPPIEATPYKVGSNIVEILQNSEEVVTLPILDANGNDRFAEFVNDTTTVLLIVSPKLDAIDQNYLEELVNDAKSKNVKIVLLTAAEIEKGAQLVDKLGIETLNSDFTVLKTMIQNFQGGAILIKNGVIEDKWAMSRLPKTINI